ncbi:MAG: hypothetical protein V7785_24205 [Bermanella sp.]
MKTLNHLTISLCILSLSACSFHSVRHSYNEPLSQCQNQLTQKISQLKKDGSLDAQDHFIQHFEFLAVDRFLAQLYSQANSKKQKQEWLKLAYEKAQLKSLVSLQNQGNDPYELESFKSCSQRLYQNLHVNPGLLWSQISTQQITPKDNYSTLSRFFGGYWFAKWVATPSIQKEKEKALSLWQQTINTPQKAITWGPENSDEEKIEINNFSYKNELHRVYEKSTLRLPSFSKIKLKKLFQYHAPQWRVFTGSPSQKAQNNNVINIPGTVQFNNEWAINTQLTRVYTHSGFTFFNGEKLLQLSYLIWFPQARYSQTDIDWYGGKFDGVYWRVTLDTDGEVLLYDSIHACGCYHTVVVNPIKIKLKANPESEAPIVAPVPWVTGPVQLTLSANQHWLIGLTSQQSVNENYTLKPLNNLRSIETPLGFKSLYDDMGFIKGSERDERFFLWPFGVGNAGAMRQWGQHATAFIGKRHFDDANWLNDFFVRIQ